MWGFVRAPGYEIIENLQKELATTFQTNHQKLFKLFSAFRPLGVGNF
jgi:ribosomal protein S17E